MLCQLVEAARDFVPIVMFCSEQHQHATCRRAGADREYTVPGEARFERLFQMFIASQAGDAEPGASRNDGVEGQGCRAVHSVRAGRRSG